MVQNSQIQKPKAFRIDAEFKKLMPRPDESELAILKQSLLRDGVLTPLIVAKLPKGKPILIDGHTRWSIIREYPKIKYLPLAVDHRLFTPQKELINRRSSYIRSIPNNNSSGFIF